MDPGITAALATGFASYLGYITPLGGAAQRGVAIVVIFALAAVHIGGVRPGARVLTALSATKIALIVGLVVAAFSGAAGAWSHFVPFFARRVDEPPLMGALAGGLVAAFFSFGGWWEVTKIAGEVREASRTLPRALWVGLVAVTGLYVAATLSFIYVIPIDEVRPGEAFVAQVGEAVFGPAGAVVVAGVVLVCVLGSLGTLLMVAPRLYFAMAQDGLFPAAAAALSPRFGTPARAILIQAVLASVIVALGTFETIVAYFVFVTVAFIMLTVASVFTLHRRDASFRVPAHPWTPLVFLVLGALLLVLLALNNPLQAGLGVAIVAAGVPIYHRVAASASS
jgi:APA family basic amino acid/polyamine antiporter